VVYISPRVSDLPLPVLPDNDPRKQLARNNRKREKHPQRKAIKMRSHGHGHGQ
jgi:hypothetical protein